jgi:hypothetical protein
VAAPSRLKTPPSSAEARLLALGSESLVEDAIVRTNSAPLPAAFVVRDPNLHAAFTHVSLRKRRRVATLPILIAVLLALVPPLVVVFKEPLSSMWQSFTARVQQPLSYDETLVESDPIKKAAFVP